MTFRHPDTRRNGAGMLTELFDDTRQSRFTDSEVPQNHGRDGIGFDGTTQHARSDQVFLSNVVVQILLTHALGERLMPQR